ncbi:MAG: GNAT family N-acetyltransferase [Anaerolineae bacterium]
MAELKSPQLRMLLRSLDNLPPVAVPTGFELRRYHPGDQQAWVDLLNSTLSLGEWDLKRAEERMNGSVHVVADGVHFITKDGVPVATACLTHHDDMQEAELGWVGVSPHFQGLSLGYSVCLATLHYTRERGYGAVVLFTDDHRLAAIKTYLKLGFEPQMVHDSHPERWREVLAKLGWQAPATATA